MSIIQEKRNYAFTFTGYAYDALQHQEKAQSGDDVGGILTGVQLANSRLHKELAGALNDLNISSIPTINKYMPKSYQNTHCYVQPFNDMIIVSFLEGYAPKPAEQKTEFSIKIHASSKFLLDDKARHQ